MNAKISKLNIIWIKIWLSTILWMYLGVGSLHWKLQKSKFKNYLVFWMFPIVHILLQLQSWHGRSQKNTTSNHIAWKCNDDYLNAIICVWRFCGQKFGKMWISLFFNSAFQNRIFITFGGPSLQSNFSVNWGCIGLF